MADISIRFTMEPQRSLGFASIGAVYMSIGTPIDHPLRMYEMHNLTNVALQISIDGIDDHFILTANSYRIIDIVSNKTSSEGWYIANGTSIYVKQLTIAPTTGSVYLSVAYGD